MGVRSVDRRGESGVVAFEICFGDPTGPCAEPSNKDGDFMRDEELDELRQGRYPNAVDLGGNIVLDKGCSLAHQREACLVAFFQNMVEERCHPEIAAPLQGLMRALAEQIRKNGLRY